MATETSTQAAQPAQPPSRACTLCHSALFRGVHFLRFPAPEALIWGSPGGGSPRAGKSSSAQHA
eukprot:8800918-Alexandrium_andersonii.AAC.1